MYIVMIFGLMLILPIASILFELLFRHYGVLNALLVGKWFVFWAVGVRLLMAGVRQIIQPRYTAENILGLKDPEATLVVRELGFANTAIGSAGLGSVFSPAWILPVAIVGAIFYGLAGINHLAHGHRSRLQNVAMISDVFAAAVLGTICLVRGFG